MRTSFVTGGTGFLGHNLIAELVAQGWEVVALHRRTSRVDTLRSMKVALAEGDVLDRASLERTMPPGVDAVFHVAGNISFWSGARAEQAAVNIEGTRNVVAAARDRGVRRVVHTSSIAAYGQPGRRVDERSPPSTESDWIGYFRTKRVGEQLALSEATAGTEVVVLQPANIIGPHDRHGWSRIFPMVKEGKLPGIPPGKGSFAHAREVARAHVAAATRGRPGERYLLGGADASYLDLVRVVSKLLGVKGPTRRVPAAALKGIARAHALAALFTRREPDMTPENATILCDTTTCDSSKAVRELGYREAPLEEMLRDCHEWMRREGLL